MLFYISMAVVWSGSGRRGHAVAYFYLPWCVHSPRASNIFFVIVDLFSAHGNSTFLVESIPMLKHTKDLHTAVNTVFYVF